MGDGSGLGLGKRPLAGPLPPTPGSVREVWAVAASSQANLRRRGESLVSVGIAQKPPPTTFPPPPIGASYEYEKWVNTSVRCHFQT